MALLVSTQITGTLAVTDQVTAPGVTASFDGFLYGSSSFALTASVAINSGGVISGGSYNISTSFASASLSTSLSKTASFLLGSGYLSNSDSLQFSPSARILNAAGNTVIGPDDTQLLSEGTQNPTLDWDAMQTYDINGNPSIDWENRWLIDELGRTQLSWSSSLLVFYGTASYAGTASILLGSIESAQYATSASFSSHSYTADTASFSTSSISASYAGTASILIGSVQSAQLATSASFASQSISASYAGTASILLGFVQSAQFATSASFASCSISASYATSASYTPMGRSIVLCSAYTPLSTGADSAEVSIPFSPLDGSSSLSWNIRRISFRAQTAETNTSSINIELSVAPGIFSPIFIASASLIGAINETASIGLFGTASSGNKLRFNVTTLGTAQNWTIISEIANS